MIKPSPNNACFFAGISQSASVHLSSPERTSDIRPGVNVILRCKVDATTDVVYEWFR